MCYDSSFIQWSSMNFHLNFANCEPKFGKLMQWSTIHIDEKTWQILKRSLIWKWFFFFFFDGLLFVFVRLNLFNHVLALFRTKFACNLAIRYSVFRWELCKGSVWESVKKAQKVCTQEEPHDLISRLASLQNGTCVKHAGGIEGSR